MKTSKQLREDRGLVDGEILTLRNKYEGTEMTQEDATKFDVLIERMEALGTEIDSTEKRENATLEATKRANTPTSFSTQSLSSEEKKAAKDFDFMGAVRQLSENDKLTGLEKELVEEGLKEARNAGLQESGRRIVIPSRFMEKRTDIDQATSAIKPTFVGAYTDALRENAVYEQIGGINIYNNLTGDFKLPVTAKQTLNWASAENSAAADSGANFTSDTLTPTRLSGYVDISNRIVAQNGAAATQAVMMDLGRAEAELINTAMFSTASVTNAPVSLAATSGVLTFTEAAYAANSSVISDLIEAEQTIANNHGLNGSLAYVMSPELLKEIKQGVKVAGIEAGMTSQGYNNYQVNGYLGKFSTGCTKSAGVSGDGLMGDFSRVHFGRWGGLSILVDPYSVAGNDQIRLVVNSNVDWSLVQGAAFVKFTSVVA